MNTYKLRFGIVLAMAFVTGLLFAAVPGGSVNAATKTVCSSGCDYTTIQAAVTGATAGDTITVAAGTYNETVTVNKSVTITLADGVVVNGVTSCFDVTASNVTVNNTNPGGATCQPASASNGITVSAELSNIVIAGLDITGASGANGINFAGVVTGVALVDNKIHGLGGDGVYFGAQPAGTMDIHGNLFQSNTGLGINAGTFTVSAEYNSWGDYDGPAIATGGDGISASVDADPWTHVDVYMVSSGAPWTNQVLNGSTITYTVKANLKNVNAADFTLQYPANLTVADYLTQITLGGNFSSESTTFDGTGRTIYFKGLNQDTPGLVENGTSLTLFTVTFTASSTVVGASLDLYLAPATGGFGMPGAGSSVNVYAENLLDSTVNVILLPTLNSTDIDGYYLTTDAQAFHMAVTNTNGGTYTNSIFYDFTITDAAPTDITSLVCDFAGVSNLVTGLTRSGDNLTGRVGSGGVGGTGLSVAVGATNYTCTATFATAGTYPISVVMMDSAATPEYTLATLSGSPLVYTKPTVTSLDMAGPYQVSIPNTFTVTVTDPSGIPEPFELNFGLPETTTLVYNSTTYPCTGGTCVVPVALTAASNDFTFTVTFNSAFSSTSYVVKLYDSDWTPDRELATYTQTGVIAYANGSVTGTFSMQGRINRAGIPITLTGVLVGFGPYSGSTINLLSGNLSLSNVVADTYTLTTLQPRYLNVTETGWNFSGGGAALTSLELKGGNAVWRWRALETDPWTYDNTIDAADASAVGTDYGKSSGFTNVDSDVNFDGKVNIFDLAMVGGNYTLTSATAYASWTP